jgi:putative hydrolase of the HAD superfamily
MAKDSQIKVLFLDIGGVLLTNGWDHAVRRRAADKFGLDYDEMDERHNQTFDTHEEGKITLDVYLQRVIFYRKRTFTVQQFKDFMFAQSQPFTEMIDSTKKFASLNNLRVGAISNEGRELTIHRIRTFNLCEFMQFFIVSCFVHFRKPDEDMYRIALDIAQVAPEDAVYIDDREMLVEVAQSLGIHSIRHKDIKTTKQGLAELGLRLS